MRKGFRSVKIIESAVRVIIEQRHRLIFEIYEKNQLRSRGMLKVNVLIA